MTPNENDDKFKFRISTNAITFAADQTLPAIRLECEPAVNDEKKGASLIKELIRLIEKDFKQMNKKSKCEIGFETSFINNRGDLLCITHDIDLFVFLCDVDPVPSKILNTKIKVILSKHLPAQRSVIIKGVANLLSDDEVKKYTSIYAIHEIIGANNGKFRYIRIDLINPSEYNQLLNAEMICMEG